MVLTCSVCGLIYQHKQSLNTHLKTTHPAQYLPSSAPLPSFSCSVCSENPYRSKLDFINHLSVVHDFHVSRCTKEFNTLEEFHAWKTQMEEETCSFYVKARGNEKKKYSQRMTFKCNRSGHYKPEGKGLRQLKTQGTRKIGGYCPSELKVDVDKNGKCSVTSIITHWGHVKEHVVLTAAEREPVPKKIVSQVPLNVNISNPDELKRLDWITKNDLHNITACFNLSSGYMKHHCDAVSVDFRVKEMRGLQEECILFYKPQGSSCEEFPALSTQDFFLAFMNGAQASLLELYGSDIICIDGINGINGSNIDLITLIVVDNLREGFPCAFLFTDRTNKDTLAVFFLKIKERLGSRMPTPNVFMSDIADSFYNAWVEIMHVPPEKRLYCSWYVDKAWRENLCKVKSTDKKSLVYKMVRSLMEEVDEKIFTENLPIGVRKMLDDPQTREFGEYFEDNYAKNPLVWAYCHHLPCDVNTNMYVESLHKCLKHFQLEGAKIRRLDRGLVAVMRFLSYKTFDRIVTLPKGKITSKLRNIRSRHKTSLGMNCEKVIQDVEQWSVASSNGQDTYSVSMYKQSCSCKLICVECDACIHRYVCTCLDSIVSNNMCKHVHLVLTKIRRMKTSMTSQEAEPHGELPQLTIDDKEETLLAQVCSGQKNRNNNCLLAVRQETLAILNNITVEVENSMSIGEIVTAKKLVISVLPAMAAAREISSDSNIQINLQDDSKKRKIEHAIQPHKRSRSESDHDQESHQTKNAASYPTNTQTPPNLNDAPTYQNKMIEVPT